MTMRLNMQMYRMPSYSNYHIGYGMVPKNLTLNQALVHLLQWKYFQDKINIWICRLQVNKDPPGVIRLELIRWIFSKKRKFYLSSAFGFSLHIKCFCVSRPTLKILADSFFNQIHWCQIKSQSLFISLSISLSLSLPPLLPQSVLHFWRTRTEIYV